MLLDSQVKMTLMLVVNTTKISTPIRPLTGPPCSHDGAYRKTCQPAHNSPSSSVARSGPYRYCMRGSANPRQPASSNSGPKTKCAANAAG